MWKQIEFSLKPRPNGFHLIIGEIMQHLPELPRVGLLNLFIKHTSAALTINENADPDVRVDMKSIFDRLVKEGEPYYRHTMEGLDDMPAHAKASLIGPSLTIPITNGHLNLGTWQGIYLCEFRGPNSSASEQRMSGEARCAFGEAERDWSQFRDYGGSRKIVATITGE